VKNINNSRNKEREGIRRNGITILGFYRRISSLPSSKALASKRPGPGSVGKTKS